MMTRYPAYSRRELRSRFRAWATGNRRRLGALSLACIALLVFETVFVVILWPGPEQIRWYLLGVMHTAVVAGFGFAAHFAFLAHDREAIIHVRGAWGEENTRSELQRARRKRLIWGWVDSLTFEVGDIDHLVVTRAGGLVAIDSKWRNSIDLADRDAMARAAGKVRLRAEGVVRTLHRHERGSHRARMKSSQVTPLLVVWGAAQQVVPDGAKVDGIEIIGGRNLVAWLDSRGGETVDKAAARDLLDGLENFRATAWISSPRSRSLELRTSSNRTPTSADPSHPLKFRSCGGPPH
jgi:hypothetical protein